MAAIIQFGIPTLDELIGKRPPVRFAADDIGDADALRRHPLYRWLRQTIPAAFQRSARSRPDSSRLRQALADDLNDLLAQGRLDQVCPGLFEDVSLSAMSWKLLDHSGAATAHQLNRLLLEDAFDGLLRKTDDEWLHFGIQLSPDAVSPASSTSVCLLGPDGTGKSVLALHLASRYAADFGECPRVLYASTDLSYAKASDIWRNFALDLPNQRRIPFLGRKPAMWTPTELRVELAEYAPLESSAPGAQARVPVANYLGLADPWARSRGGNRASAAGDTVIPLRREIAFINLAAETAGDDWGFLNRLVAALPECGTGQPRHLLIIDAVEGLEALVGERDMFGQARTRRSRIAQVLQGAADKCHVVLTVEEPREGERLPEEFVADVVIRLRRTVVREYVRLTAEVVKSRGQAHTRGQHLLLIRSGAGIRTGVSENPDDPQQSQPCSLRGGTQAYVHVLGSLHTLPTERQSGGPLSPSGCDIDLWSHLFGVADPLKIVANLGRHASTVADDLADPSRLDVREIRDLQSLPSHRLRPSLPLHRELSAVARRLLLDRYLFEKLARNPSRLPPWVAPPREDLSPEMQRATNWRLLEQAYRPEVPYAGFGITHLDFMLAGGDRGDRLAPGLPSGTTTAVIGDDGTHKSRLGRAFLSGCFEDDNTQGVAILVTTQAIDADSLARRLHQHLGHAHRRGGARSPTALKGEYLLCRRLEPQDCPPAMFFHIVRSCVEEAKFLLQRTREPDLRREEWPNGRWYPQLGLIRLVIDDWSTIRDTYPTLATDPLLLPALLAYLEREQVTTLLIDTQSGGPSHIVENEADRELRALVRHHLYTWYVPFYGEQRVAISAIPPISDLVPVLVRELLPARALDEECLRVDPHFEMYSGFERGTARRVPLMVRLHAEIAAAIEYMDELNQVFGELFQPAEGARIVVSETSRSYDLLRDFCYLQSDMRLDYTLVFQVDEFWSSERSKLQSQLHYLAADTHDISNDAFLIFQPQTENRDENRRRYRFFRPLGYWYREGDFLEPQRARTLDRVPFMWDFGFLLCRQILWERSASEKLSGDLRDRTVGEVWKALPRVTLQLEDVKPPCTASWRELLEATAVVARQHRRQSEGEKVPAFDIDMGAAQTFASLILEVWASEIPGEGVFRKARHEEPGAGLLQLSGDYREALYRAWLLLGELLPASDFSERGVEFVARPAAANAVTARHWYSSASDACKNWNPLDPLVPVGLPGRFSVRGDWFLGVAGGSRSPRLGAQAIDLLSSRRGNVHRLQIGLGLPTRDLGTLRAGEARDLTPDDEATACRYYEELRTALAIPENGTRCSVRYRQLLDLGAPIDGDVGRAGFQWLWRSTIQSYHLHARLWERWLCRVLTGWTRWQEADRQERRRRRSGFEQYDHIVACEGRGSESWKSLPSWKAFDRECTFLIHALRATAA